MNFNLTEQIELSRSNKKTSIPIRNLTLGIADAALREEFGDDYSIRCLQASAAIQTVLQSFGIHSEIWVGSVCLSRVSTGDSFTVGWAGFWGDDHHVWLITEFEELVDLSISQLHMHPATSGTSDEPIPAFWYEPIHRWPPIVYYIPDGICTPELPSDEQDELDRTLASAIRIKNEVESGDIAAPEFDNVIHGADHLQSLTTTGNPWLTKSLEIQHRKIPRPTWVSNKLDELAAQYSETVVSDPKERRKLRKKRQKRLQARKKK